MNFFDELSQLHGMMMTYDEFIDYLDECKKCPLHLSRTNLVPGSGPNPCRLMLIGEAPGETEDTQGQPFVGRAGQLLTKILESVNIQRPSDIYISNLVKCRPPGNRVPHDNEILACRQYLLRQFMIVKPHILILAGSPALKALLGKDKGITTSRGQWFYQDVPYMQQKLAIMPVFHPSYLLRNPSRETGSPKWLVWQDMQEIERKLKEP